MGSPKKFRAFFLSPAEISFFLFSLRGPLVELWPLFKAMARPKCGFRLVSFCVSPGSREGSGEKAQKS